MRKLMSLFRPSLIAKYYSGRKAKEYEASRAQSKKWLFEYNALEAMLALCISDSSDFEIIDLPVGTNRFYKLYSSLRDNVTIHAVDLSPDMLDIASTKGCRNYRFYMHDIVTSPLLLTANIVVCFRFLNLFELSKVKNILHNISKSANEFIIMSIRLIDADYVEREVIDNKIHLHRKECFLQIIQDLGFEVICERTMTNAKPGVYYVLCLGRTSSSEK